MISYKDLKFSHSYNENNQKSCSQNPILDRNTLLIPNIHHVLGMYFHNERNLKRYEEIR